MVLYMLSSLIDQNCHGVSSNALLQDENRFTKFHGLKEMLTWFKFVNKILVKAVRRLQFSLANKEQTTKVQLDDSESEKLQVIAYFF